MDKYLGKKYKLKSSDNFEDYLKYVGIPYLTRKLGLAVTPTAVLTKNEDGSYTFTMSTSFRTVAFSFRVGEEFEEERADGVKVKSLMEFEGDEMIQTQVEDNGRKSTHVRKFTQDTLTVITTAEGWNGTCTRIYELIE